MRDNDVRARIDAFFIKLENDSSLTRGFVIQYGSPKDNRKREELIKEFIKFRKYDVNRIVFLYKGEEGTIRTRLWLVPEGSDASNID